MLIATLMMYMFSSLHWALYLDQAICALQHTCVPFRVRAQKVAVQAVIPLNVSIATNIVYGYELTQNGQFIISDAIIVWRTWLIWDRAWFVLVVAAPLFLATAGTLTLSWPCLY